MAKKKEPSERPTGRPSVPIDLDQLKTCGMIHCTHEEIAAFFKCSRRTITNRMREPEFLQVYEDGKLLGNVNLKRNSWRLAQAHGSSAVNMTIYLRKQWLGETDHPPATMIQTNNTLTLTHASESDLRALESVLARIADASTSQGRISEEGGGSAAPAG